MTTRNRVTPLGDIIADPARGLVYGNRGCLHDASGRIVRAYNGKRWIACVLSFKGRRRRPLVQSGRYTGLFFLDEATAFAAGHRPCAYCRRDDYKRFASIVGMTRADDIDARLHSERLSGRQRRLHEARIDELPDGAFVLCDDSPHLVSAGTLFRWTPSGYESSTRAAPPAHLITPPLLVDVLRAGWQGSVPLLHPTAGD